MEKLMIGGCLCASVRYEARPKPSTAYYCHCRDCQIGSGSAFHVAVLADQSSFRLLSGEIATYSKVADSGNKIDRVFCPKCGTPVYWTGEGFPDLVVLTISSLDDADVISPSRELWTDSSVSWCRIQEGIESSPRRPKSKWRQKIKCEEP